MTYDQWKTTDPRDGEPETERERPETESLFDELNEVIEAAKHAEWKAKKRINELESALEEALEYFEDRYDVRDGSDGEQLPNKEMQLGTTIDEALHGIRF